jgi:hypothetical protein
MERTPEDLVVEYAETLPYLASPHDIHIAMFKAMDDEERLWSYLGKRIYYNVIQKLEKEGDGVIRVT